MADFGLKIGLEGEKEFKNALAEINQSFKVLGSEMKLVESEFDKNDIPGVLEATNILVAIVIGAASGLSATGTNQAVLQLTRGKSTDETAN